MIDTGGNDGEHRSLFLTIAGAPNAGKSSLLNKLVGTKIAATSHKAQMTRNSIRGVLTEGDVQLVFIDTPGFFKPRHSLENKMVQIASRNVQDVDLVCVVIDSYKGPLETDLDLIKECSGCGRGVVVVLNKTDKVKEDRLLTLAKEVFDMGCVKDVFFTSCTKGRGVTGLKDYLVRNAKSGDWHYDLNDKTDRDLKFRISEVTREKLFSILRDELPYTINVDTESMKRVGDIWEIDQMIILQRLQHKHIVIGAKGSMMNKIARMSTIEMERLLDCKVRLLLSIKVVEKWIDHWVGD